MRFHRHFTGSLPAACLFIGVALVGCGRPESPAPTSPGATADKSSAPAVPDKTTAPPPPAPTLPTTPFIPPPGDFKVALVMSGPTTDNGWNTGALKAFQAVKSEMKLSKDNAAYIDKQAAAGDQEKSLRAFASKKYTLVFGHGSEYEAPALKMEADFPHTLFVISSGRQVGKNTMPIVFQLEDGAYMEGMVGAAISKTGKVAFVGAEESVPLKSIYNAFAAGAKAYSHGSVTVLPAVYTGSWDDVGKAKQQTLALLDQDADVIMQDVDSAAQGVFNAVQERAKSGKTVYALGTNSDQNMLAPDVILASAPIYSDKAFVQIAKAAKAGKLIPSDAPFGMKEGVVDFVLNPKLKDKLPQGLTSLLEEARGRIVGGNFKVPKDQQ